MKGLLKVFFDDVPETPKKETSKSSKTPDVKTYPDETTSTSYPSASATTYVPTATPTSEVKQHFYDVIKDSNLPGPDFYEFNEMLKAMAAIPIESAKYTAAFSGLSVQGMTKQTLLESAEKYKSIITNTLNEFDSAYQQMFQDKVTNKKTLIETKSQEMQKLSQQIAQLNEEIKSLNDEASNAEIQLKMQKENFISSGNAVASEIDAEINKINSYIA